MMAAIYGVRRTKVAKAGVRLNANKTALLGTAAKDKNDAGP